MARKVQMGEGAVPWVVTYRKYLKKPKLKRHRRFVGVRQMLRNLLVKSIEMIEEAAYETETEVVDPGQSVAVHWAIQVEDPWDTTTGVEKNLIAIRHLNDVPPSGVHFEVITPPREQRRRPEHDHGHDHPHEGNGAEAPRPRFNPRELTPEQLTMLQRQREQQALLSDGVRTPRGGFRPPPAPQYGPREVKTLDEELATEGLDEDVEDLDGASSVGEDD